MNKRILLPWLAIALTAFCQLSAQTDSVSWNLEEGDQLEVTLTQTTDTKTIVDVRETSIESINRIVFDWDVNAVSTEGDMTIVQAIRSVKLSVGDPAVPSQAIEYDTAGKNDDISKTSKKLMEQVVPLIGLKIEVVMSKLGKIKEVTLPRETADTINQLPETLQLRKLFSEQGLAEMFGASAIVLPGESLEEGESWKDELPVVTAFGKFNRVRTYTFTGVRKIDEKPFAEFDVASSMVRMDDDGSKLELKGGELISYSGTGKLTMNLEEGFFESGNVTNEIQTQTAYREKKIKSTVSNRIEMSAKKIK